MQFWVRTYSGDSDGVPCALREIHPYNAVQDGSGEIDLEELRTVMTSLGYSPTDKQLEDMMAKVCNLCCAGSAAQD